MAGGLLAVRSGPLQVDGGLVVRAAPDGPGPGSGDGVRRGDAGVNGVSVAAL